jgi:ribonuclease BN (tRNA processing enzyme)
MLTRRGVIGAAAAFAAAPALATGKSRLVLLGTAGGPTPKPNRAAPAQVILVDGAAYVIDCGNGVGRQLVLAGVPLRSLRAIFITHMHSDHVADLGNLQWLAWSDNLTTPVDSYGPPPLAPLMRSHELTRPGLVLDDGRVRVTAALVNHPPMVPSFAYRFDCPDRSIVLSGDTSASPALVALAKGADVLVHEILLESAVDSIVRNAPDAKTLRQHLLASHSTGEQVGRAATEAGVKTLVLSHFVPGGAPFITDDVWLAAVRPHFAGEIIIGRDLLEV